MRRLAWALLLCLAILMAGAVSPAQAQPRAGLPFIDLCHPDPPLAATPEQGLAGLVGERPNRVSPQISADHIWTHGGFAGMSSHTYDLGCGADPSSYARLASANTDVLLTNAIVGIGDTITSLTDSLDRRAWNPTWIVSFLGNFAARAVAVLRSQIWIPMIGLGLIAATAMLLYRNRKGDVMGAASGAGWALLVLIAGALLMTSPTLIASESQQFGGGLVAGLNGGVNPSDAATDRIVSAVQYNGWLRRTFGSEDTAVAKKYGLRLLDDSRISWTEYDRVKNDPQALADLIKTKSDDYKVTAGKVEKEDPGAYEFLTGASERSGVSILELLFALFASLFRLAVDLLMVTACILVVFLGLVWIVASPWLVTPSGRDLGKILFDSTARCLGYVLAAAVGSWLYSIYLHAAMAPGMSAWWSVLLLFLGTIVFWSVLRPDRKMLSMMSMGQVNGSGYVMKVFKTAALAYFAGRVAGDRVADRVAEPQPAGGVSEEVVSPPLEGRIVDGPIVVPGTRAVDGRTVIEGEVTSSEAPYVSVTERGLPSGEAMYQRDVPQPDAATPPPAGSIGEVEVYQRPVTGVPDDELVACPWCGGEGCGHCDGGGEVPRWVTYWGTDEGVIRRD